MQKNLLQMQLMLKKFTLFIVVLNLLGLLCSPLVYAESEKDSLENNFEEIRTNSEKLINEVSKLQDQFGKSEMESAPKPTTAQMQQSLDMLLSHYGPMTEKQISDEMIKNINSKTIKNILIKFPKVAIFFARLLKDKEAFKKLFAIMGKDEELKNAALWLLGTFIAGFFINKLLFKPYQSFLSKLRAVLIRFITLTSARIGIVVYFYGENLGPALKIAKGVFFNS